jgi:hypothetical protein
MNKIKNIVFAGLAATVLTSCNKQINDLQNNPNKASSVTPDLVLGYVLKDISGTGSEGALGGINSWDNVHKYNQYFLGAYAYYGDNQYNWQRGSFDSYIVLKDVLQMEKEAATRGKAAVNPYEAIGKFTRAWYYYNLSSMMGDIPLTDALQGINDPTPTYTSQKEVFKYVLNILDTANTHFASLIASGDNTIAGSAQDIYFNGDLTKWQKTVNSFKLRVLIALSKKTSDPDLNVAGQFATIVNNPSTYPVFTSQADDFKFTYIPTYNQYPLHANNFGSTSSRYGMAQTYIKTLTDLKDPRVFVTSEPAWKIVDSLNLSPTDFRAFIGESTGQSMDIIETEASARLFSFINRKRYYSTFVGEPDVLIGYKELCFNMAEAINRGWITGDAEAWYKKGIVESMNFYGIDVNKTNFTAYFLKSGGLSNITSYPFTFDFNNYYNQPAVKYAGGPTGLQQILKQKYIAFFQNSGWEAYFNFRRAGVPDFKGGTGVGNNGIIPLRWGYPTSEQNQNETNYKAALQSQYGGSDNINGVMWLVK